MFYPPSLVASFCVPIAIAAGENCFSSEHNSFLFTIFYISSAKFILTMAWQYHQLIFLQSILFPRNYLLCKCHQLHYCYHLLFHPFFSIPDWLLVVLVTSSTTNLLLATQESSSTHEGFTAFMQKFLLENRHSWSACL